MSARLSIALVAGGVVLHAATVWAAEAPRRKPTAVPNTVSELVVTPEAKCLPARKEGSAPAPRIVSTFPARNAVVRPGYLVLRVTFDRPMSCSGFFTKRPLLNMPCAPLRQKMVLSFDRRTIRLICKTEPNTPYGLDIGDTDKHAFVSLDGQPVTPEELTFTTSGGPLVETIPESLGEDADAPRRGR